MAGVGEALGVIGLVALFSTCVECFGYFKASQRIDKDSEILLVKLDIEKARLLVWGDAVRIFETNSSSPSQNSILHDEAARQLLSRYLKSIESVLTDTERLTRDYGVAEEHHASQREIDFVSANSMAVFQTSWRRFFVRNSSAFAKTKRPPSKDQMGDLQERTLPEFNQLLEGSRRRPLRARAAAVNTNTQRDYGGRYRVLNRSGSATPF